jgi:hypothetical protein
LIFNYEDRVEAYKRLLRNLNNTIKIQEEIIQVDSIKLSKKDEVIDLADQQTKIVKKQRNLAGLVAILAIVLAVFT